MFVPSNKDPIVEPGDTRESVCVMTFEDRLGAVPVLVAHTQTSALLKGEPERAISEHTRVISRKLAGEFLVMTLAVDDGKGGTYPSTVGAALAHLRALGLLFMIDEDEKTAEQEAKALSYTMEVAPAVVRVEGDAK